MTVALRTFLVMGCVLSVCASSLAQTVGTGHISGRVTDAEGSVLPGVAITVSGPGLREQAITDERGRFDVEGLLQSRPTTYRVKAELAGFSTLILERISAEPGKGAEVDIRLQVACLETILHVDGGFAENLKRADGVFLLRVESSSPPRRRETGHYCGNATEHVATVIETAKDRHGAAPMTLRFLVEGNHQYDQGTHHFAFLSWEPECRCILGADGQLHRSSAGRLVDCAWPNDETPCGPASDVLTALHSLVAQP